MSIQSKTPKKMRWVGRLISTLVVLFLLSDSSMKMLKLTPAIEATVHLGYPESTVFGIGLVLLICTVLYSIPRTAMLGAILLTGYLGGATATQARLESLWFLLQVVLGLLVWVGLFLRDDGRLRTLIPLRKEQDRSVIEGSH
ncbi:MAG TPA: DoxX family protein [Rhodothermales bacterium]|nr:DoxX family protein [Rhodothermales bacterium]